MEKKPSRWEKVKRGLIFLAVVVSTLIIVTPFALAAYHRVTLGNWPSWSGFGDYYDTAGELIKGKTLWDWMDLLIIPFVLALGAYFFNRSESRNELEIAEQARKTDREIATDRQQEATIQNYLDKIADLLLKEKLLEKKENKDDPTVSVAQARTVTTIRTLDENRRNILFHFLRDAKLADFILAGASLNEADLSKANLYQINLSGAMLYKANLRSAYLREANLNGAKLIGANLSGANLSRADLSWANLSGANLSSADLSWVNLNGAFLLEADLSGAILSGANVTEELLNRARSLSRTVLPDGIKHD